jgi:hypothetical protein
MVYEVLVPKIYQCQNKLTEHKNLDMINGNTYMAKCVTQV